MGSGNYKLKYLVIEAFKKIVSASPGAGGIKNGQIFSNFARGQIITRQILDAPNFHRANNHL